MFIVIQRVGHIIQTAWVNGEVVSQYYFFVSMNFELLPEFFLRLDVTKCKPLNRDISFLLYAIALTVMIVIIFCFPRQIYRVCKYESISIYSRRRFQYYMVVDSSI